MFPLFTVVLVDPEIPWNTGNVGRTCLGLGAELHLVGRIGFSLDDKYVKRSGLDYWPRVALKTFPDVRRYFREHPADRMFFFSARARRSLWRTPIPSGSFLVFGSESRGLPNSLRKRFPGRFHRIPLTRAIRSLNLSTAVGMALGEASRQAAQPKPGCR